MNGAFGSNGGISLIYSAPFRETSSDINVHSTGWRNAGATNSRKRRAIGGSIE